MDRPKLDRRHFLFGTGLAAAAGAIGKLGATVHDGELGAPPRLYKGGMPWIEGQADEPPGSPRAPLRMNYFTPDEYDFVAAAVDRLIPPDSVGPGATEAGVPTFIDRQLAGPYGRGDHYYLGGPWQKGTPEQGYQSRFSPAQLYRAAIAAIYLYTCGAFNGMPFASLAVEHQDELLTEMEAGRLILSDGVDAKVFFAMLLQNTKEGYFSDPIYGGNKDMAAWKMIGFPGAHYDYREWVSRHGEPVPFEPVGFKGRPGWNKEA